MCDFGERGTYALKHVFFFCRTFLLVTKKDIRAFLDIRRYTNSKTGSRNYLAMEDLFCLLFPAHREPHS